eukprot:COSAG05_NODE_2496_length_2982_cov_28.024974_2_plen_91_part_00
MRAETVAVAAEWLTQLRDTVAKAKAAISLHVTHSVTARRQLFRLQPTDTLHTLVRRIGTAFGVAESEITLEVLSPQPILLSTDSAQQLSM